MTSVPDEFRHPGDFTDDEWWEPQRALQQAATDAARDAYRPRLAPKPTEEGLMTAKAGRDGDYLLFRCPGCDELHQIHTKPNGWTWDGSLDAPTFSPSVLVQGPLGGVADGRCHSFVRAGQIEFLSDCTHALAGQTVDLPYLSKKD